MVLCAIISGSNPSDDGSGNIFLQYPNYNTTDRYGEARLDLHKKERDGFVAAISRKDLDMTVLHV